MNASTPEQRTEVIYALYKAWESAIEEAGDMSLCHLLNIEGTDTELVDHLNTCYLAEPYVWTNFKQEDLDAETVSKYKKAVVEGKAWAKIAETYNMNNADRNHCRYMIEDDVDARVKQEREKAKASKTAEVLEALLNDWKAKV